jgi:hypothetical protein
MDWGKGGVMFVSMSMDWGKMGVLFVLMSMIFRGWMFYSLFVYVYGFEE